MCIVTHTDFTKLLDMPLCELLEWQEVFEDIIARSQKEAGKLGG